MPFILAFIFFAGFPQFDIAGIRSDTLKAQTLTATSSLSFESISSLRFSKPSERHQADYTFVKEVTLECPSADYAYRDPVLYLYRGLFNPTWSDPRAPPAPVV
ncbi:hypothetical protein [Bdellovibrio sp. NC01]|uniref:hypothetical protein n=1 Tax=Bdellovibrio sp. NC01 TaxID=2220073 RepID=UPI0011627CBE|nr:hypothetical protein [Bdellovibrio sp. NC01]QDK37565.1 hypothetical protein DOE51_08195 [Bdellovibrio sp. NC01]